MVWFLAASNIHVEIRWEAWKTPGRDNVACFHWRDQSTTAHTAQRERANKQTSETNPTAPLEFSDSTWLCLKAAQTLVLQRKKKKKWIWTGSSHQVKAVWSAPAGFQTSYNDTCNQPGCLHFFVQHKLLHRWFRQSTDGTWTVFISCSVPRSPTHLVCSEKHLCTNLFVTIYWRGYLSSCHALVAPWCLKNMVSHKFLATRLSGRLGTRAHKPSDGWIGGRKRKRRQRNRVQGIYLKCHLIP